MIDTERLASSLRLHEGVRLKPYEDTAIPPRLTIGVGRNLSDRGISQEEADILLRNDIAETQHACLTLPWFAPLDSVRQNVIAELIFNMGLPRTLGFADMIAAIRAQDFPRAAAELLDSRWARQVGESRSTTLARMLRTGEWE